MPTKPTITNLKAKQIKLRERPEGRTTATKKPSKTGLASGLTQKAIKVFRLAKKQQQEQAVVD
jgi:hypothetical protein